MEVDVNPLSLLEVSIIEPEEEEVLLEMPNGDSLVDPLAMSREEVYCPPNRPVKNVVIPMSRVSPEQKINLHVRALSEISPEEQIYRRNMYPALDLILKKRLHCTMCDEHIGCSLVLNRANLIHPLLRTLVCVRCYHRYSYITFPLSVGGSDVRCRWCGQSENSMMLRNCAQCPFSFCERCIVRNCLQTSLVNSQQWICFVCKKKDLWPHRALVWALISILNNMSGKKYRDPVWCTDVSTCCRKRKSPALEPEVTVRKLAPKLLPQTSNNNNNINSSSNTTNVYTVINNSPRVQVVQVAPPGQQFLAEPNTTVAAPYVDTRWFQMAANYLIDNIGVICEQIKDVRDSVSNYDTIANISTAVTSLCNLTTVAGQQLSKSSTTLKRDWKNRTGPTPNNLGVLHHALAQSAVQTPPAQVQPPPPPPPPPSPPKPPSPPPPPPPPPPPTQPTPVVSSLEKENVSANSNQKVTKKTTSARNGIAKKAKSRVRFSVPKPVSIPELLQRYKIRECKVVLNKCC